MNLATIGLGLIVLGSVACGSVAHGSDGVPSLGVPSVIQLPRVQSGNQAVITCEDGIVHVDNGLDGIVWGESVRVKWASPIIGGTDMVKTLYCLNGSIRAD